MDRALEATPIADGVYWVGALDWGIRNFHGYLTSRGTTYNAYLVLGDEPILIDTVKAPFKDEMMSRIASVLEPGRIRHVISNHAELDHSGALPEVLRTIRPDSVLTSTMGARALKDHFHWDLEPRVVKDGERVELGNKVFQFIHAPMLHWPDSMLAYLEGPGLLFTNDAFGMHLCSSQRFDDQLSRSLLEYEAAKYYANILLPYSGRVQKLGERLSRLRLPTSMIIPDHGPIWRKDMDWITRRYLLWAAQVPTPKATVVFDTMWQSTAVMAQAVGDGLMGAGIDIELLPLDSVHRSDVATKVLLSGGLAVGSPTLNNSIYPSLADLLFYLRGLQPKNLLGIAFGSYGWGGQAVGILEKLLGEMSVELAAPGVRVRHVPDARAMQQCRALGARLGERLMEECNQVGQP